MNRPLLVFGTRPEAIKLAPVVRAFERAGVDPRICVTGQHRQMLDQVLSLLQLKPHHDLDVMRPGQDLFQVTTGVLNGLKPVLESERPDVVIVQGDTTTALAASLAAFYLRIPIAHVEAGLRTWDKFSPFPEEMNRRLAADLADYHFAPTERARANLVGEGRDPARIWVTGNTAIDALHYMHTRVNDMPAPPGVDAALADRLGAWSREPERIVLVTGHRRESFGAGFANIAEALRDVSERNPNVRIIYPLHLNPNVREPILRTLSDSARVHLIDPLPYGAFVWLMARCHLVLTDSGGIQEEAPALGKPVLVMRETTERPEAVEAGTSRLAGTTREGIREHVETLLHDRITYERMARAVNPFGDGNAASRIVKILMDEVIQ